MLFEIYSRTRQGWRSEEIEGLDKDFALDALGIALPLAEIYEGLALAGTGGAARSTA